MAQFSLILATSRFLRLDRVPPRTQPKHSIYISSQKFLPNNSLWRMLAKGSGIAALLFALLIAIPAFAEKKTENKDEKAGETATPTENAFTGEVVCEVDISFTWKRTPPQITKLNDQGKQTLVDPDPDLLEPIEEHFTRIGATGYTEEDTKNRVATKVPPTQIQARRACEELHQEESSCIARKLRMNESDLQILDYASRTALRRSIERDCATNRGICLETKSSPIICYVSAVTPVESGASGSSAPKEEDKKKGGKK